MTQPATKIDLDAFDRDRQDVPLTPHAQRVLAFMRLAGQRLPGVPSLPEGLPVYLRMCYEELLELTRALGYEPRVFARCAGSVFLREDELEFVRAGTPDLVETADGLADLRVVTTGLSLECGIADRELQELIDASNLAKFAPGGYKDKAGKWRKPPDWTAPDIASLLVRLGWQQGGK